MNKKINIAIVDDGVNYNQLIFSNKPTYNLEVTENLKIKKRRKFFQLGLSHATICAGIINKYCSGIVINSIKVLSSENRKGNIDQLIKALYWCAENNIDIVNLSLGSVYFKDFSRIKKCINDITSRGVIIVAALNNNDKFTMPACLSHVIGVKSDKDFSNECYHFISKPWYGIDVLASGIHKLKFKSQEYITKSTNSYAAPLITSIIARFIQEYGCSLSFEQIRFLLYKNSNNFNNEDFLSSNYVSLDWVHPCNVAVSNWMNESNDHMDVLIHSIPNEISQIETILNKEIKNVIHTSDSYLVSNVLLQSPSLYKKLWDFNYYSTEIGSHFINIHDSVEIPVIQFKNLGELSSQICALFKQNGYFAVSISDTFEYLDFENDILEIIPNTSEINKFLSYIYKKYTCDLIICNFYKQKNYCTYDYYDVTISKSKNIEIRYRLDGKFYEKKMDSDKSIDEIYMNIVELFGCEADK